jgi:glycosyltransferase involved in cell wall biosynthesis
MKIVHLITTLGVGGAEKHLLWLGAGQTARGHSVHVIYLKGDGELGDAFRQAGLSVEQVPMPGLAGAPVALGRLVDALRRVDPDVVHTHLLKADMLGALAVSKAGDAVLVSSKHNDERALLRWPVSLIHGLLSKRADRIIALSDHVARFVARHGRVPRERITRIYYGVDAEALESHRPREETRAELGVAESTRLLVCVGRLAEQKDHPTLLRALVALPDDVELLIVGGDPFGGGVERLSRLADELGLGGRAHFLGIRHDVQDLLAASELFVLPSLWEGLGLVFLEAMAVRLPIVASDVSAIPEVVEDGVSGWLVPPGDPAALATAVTRALSDDHDRQARGMAGHARLLELFALPPMIDRTLAVYDELLAARPAGR